MAGQGRQQQLAGAVMAGIALPAVGALGLAAKGSVESFDELPANLKTPPLSQRTTIVLRNSIGLAMKCRPSIPEPVPRTTIEP